MTSTKRFISFTKPLSGYNPNMPTSTFTSLPALTALSTLEQEAAISASEAKPIAWAAINEAMLVFVLLSTIAFLSGCKHTDWLGAAAVFITFLHGQLSFDMEESQGKMPVATVQNYHWSSRLFVTKEILWITTFMMTGSWPLCAGSVIFATYPKWRAWLRQK
ncbi:hypothetical protein BH11CYA1_BH11CYA1_23360 [soil metagenome]